MGINEEKDKINIDDDFEDMFLEIYADEHEPASKEDPEAAYEPELSHKQESAPAQEESAPAEKKTVGEDRSARIITIINRIIVVIVVTVFMFGIFGLSAEYVIVKGPSESLRNTFVRTMLETRRFGFVSNIFLSNEEVAAIKNATSSAAFSVSTDASLITVASAGEEGAEIRDYGLVDEDGDGIIIETIVGKGYEGKMMIVLDPSRVFVGKPQYYGGIGETLDSMCARYGAIGGINAGGFFDVSGTGMGGDPAGLTICEGEYFNNWATRACFAGFDHDNILHVGYFDYNDAAYLNLRDGVTFGPALVVNGVRADDGALASGINPRTAIGQRADGAVLLLVIDGRQASSIGATYGDIADVMLDYGAVNACNMDGGSSTCMYFDGDYINSCAVSIVRPLPTAFLVRR